MCMNEQICEYVILKEIVKMPNVSVLCANSSDRRSKRKQWNVSARSFIWIWTCCISGVFLFVKKFLFSTFQAVMECCNILNSRIDSVRKKMKSPSWKELIAKCFSDGVNLSASYMYVYRSLNVISWSAVINIPNDILLTIALERKWAYTWKKDEKSVTPVGFKLATSTIYAIYIAEQSNLEFNKEYFNRRFLFNADIR